MSEIVEVKPSERLPVARTDFGAIVNNAIEKGIDPAALGQLLEQWKDYRRVTAKADFDAAMACFKAECPPIPRRTENSQFQVIRNGVKVNRSYAALEDIEATIRGPLGRNGLSFRWSGVDVKEGRLTMTCIVSHASGHSETSPVVVPVESRAGCSEQQKYGSAMTYAQRYSLIQALGLTTCDEDADGAEPDTVGPCITEEQAITLDDMLAAIGPDAKARFLKSVGRSRLADIPAGEYKTAHATIKDRLDKKGKA